MQSLRACVLAASLPALCAAAITQKGNEQRKALRSSDEGVVQPLSFDQRLLICNAYPSESPILVKKNGQETLADAGHPLSFRECRYASGHVQPHDKLDLMLRDVEIHGTFEVGTLPSSDALLLLVLQRREGSPLVSFQSFAFPVSSGRKDAQLALIDAFQSNLSSSFSSHLQVEDHLGTTKGGEGKAVSKRVEQLNFNRVYSIEEGTYDASVAERFLADNSSTEAPLELHAQQTLRLRKDKNYVVIRTGDRDHFGESLVVFPPEDIHSGCRALTPFWLAAVATTMLAWTRA